MQLSDCIGKNLRMAPTILHVRGFRTAQPAGPKHNTRNWKTNLLPEAYTILRVIVPTPEINYP